MNRFEIRPTSAICSISFRGFKYKVHRTIPVVNPNVKSENSRGCLDFLLVVNEEGLFNHRLLAYLSLISERILLDGVHQYIRNVVY